jgi:hypothetical protein
MQGLGWRPTLMGTSWAGRPVQELILRPAAVPDTRARGRGAQGRAQGTRRLIQCQCQT